MNCQGLLKRQGSACHKVIHLFNTILRSSEVFKRMSNKHSNRIHLLLLNIVCTLLHPTPHSPLLLHLHRRNLRAGNHLVKLLFRLIFHSPNVVHRQAVPFVHLADQLAHRARENLDLLGSNEVLDDGLQTEILEAAR